MSKTNAKTLIILFGNPGGDGKTTICRSIETLARTVELSVELVCADAGNGAIRQVLPSAASVAWGAAPQVGRSIVAAYEACDVLIIDCGANASTAAYNILDLLIEARAEAVKQGRQCFALLPIGTNKPGAAGMAEASKAAFLQAGFEAYIVLNNRDGSSEYLGLSDSKLPLPEVPQLAPGFMSFLNQQQGGWHALLANHPEGYSLATDFVADWLQRISALDPIRNVLGIPPGGISFGRSPAIRLRNIVSRLSMASDRAILANHKYETARAALLACNPQSPDLTHMVKRFQEAAHG